MSRRSSGALLWLLLALGLWLPVACSSTSVPAAREFLSSMPTIAFSSRKASNTPPDTWTPTPTCTPTNTSTPTPTFTPLPTNTPTPTLTPTPPPWESHLNVVFLGIDKRASEDGSWRTDTIILVSIDPTSKAVFMLSIPRDLWVGIPGNGQNRINAVDFLGESTKYPGGGFGLLKRTIEENLGLRVDHCVRIDFESFWKVIDILGGITLEVECPLEDWFPDPTSPSGFKHMYVPAGKQTMDGELALQYIRSRRGTGDFDRARRQQKVLLAIRDKALHLDILPKIPALWKSIRPAIQTDLSLRQIPSLAKLGAEVRPQNIRTLIIDLSVTSNWTTPEGYQVLLPNRGKIQQALERLFAGPPSPQIITRPPVCPKLGEAENP